MVISDSKSEVSSLLILGFNPPILTARLYQNRDPLWETRIDNFERILYEDTQFAPQIQESVESPGFKGISLNYQERRIYHWHEELDRRIGADAIDPALCVTPRLDAFVESQ